MSDGENESSELAASKNVGEVFVVLASGAHHAELRARLAALADECTFAEMWLWRMWLAAEPVTALELAAQRRAYADEQARYDLEWRTQQAQARERGKDRAWIAKHVKRRWARWPKLPNVTLPAAREAFGLEAVRTRTIAGELAPAANSYVYDATANHVAKDYLRYRRDILLGKRRLPAPASDARRIIFREKAVRVVRHPEREDWFRLRLNLWRDAAPIEIDVGTRAKSAATLAWLAECADGNVSPSGGTLSCQKRKGKDCWQIALARARRPGERAQVLDPVSGRTLQVYAPLDQCVFLRCEVFPRVPGGPPWIWDVAATDIVRTKRLAQTRRREMGMQYAQSAGGARHGHGRERALSPQWPWTGKYAHQAKTWIEQRSAAIVAQAVAWRCEAVHCEDLTRRDPRKLLLGSFPYFKLLERIECKAKTAGLAFKRTKKLAAFEDDASPAASVG